jgi:hypothetical protein
MSIICAETPSLSSAENAVHFSFDAARLPLNGIYVLFERGEGGHGGKTVVLL